jgi:hypothetical protein
MGPTELRPSEWQRRSEVTIFKELRTAVTTAQNQTILVRLSCQLTLGNVT